MHLDLERESLPKLVEELNAKKAQLYYMVDHRENKREIFHDPGEQQMAE